MNTFQKWLSANETHLPALTVSLFKDSLKCFYNELERPAYLLAYQGVMNFIRDILMRSDAPLGYTEAEWQAKLKPTQNDDTWDVAVFELIKKGPTHSGNGLTKAAPLNIPDSLRSQFDFWRMQRNVCAHYKEDPFLRAHVEAFYGFITHWLMKISSVGGVSFMIEKFEAFCDPSKTPSNADINPMIDLIPHHVLQEEYDEFIKKGIKVFTKSYRRDAFEFISALLSRSNGPFSILRNKMIAVIRDNERLQQILLEKDAKYIVDLLKTPEEVREFWYDKIHDLNRNRMNVFATMLEAGIIPEEQKQEAFLVMQDKLKAEDRNLSLCSIQSLEVLRRHGYFDLFVTNYITPEEMNSGSASKLSRWCYQSNFFIDHLANANMTKDLIDRLLLCFGSGKNVPYTIRDRLKIELWNRNQDNFKDRFTATARAEGINFRAEWIV